jgi:hypothetical protein
MRSEELAQFFVRSLAACSIAGIYGFGIGRKAVRHIGRAVAIQAPAAAIDGHVRVETCGPPDEQCQLDPRADLYEDIEPAPADD